jgi:pimeloyl-ACP methyl ester carboxylesterase
MASLKSNKQLLVIFSMIFLFCTPCIISSAGFKAMTTVDGFKFEYEFSPCSQKGPSVILIPGMSGWYERQYYRFASEINDANFNFLGFERYPVTKSGGTGLMVSTLVSSRRCDNAFIPSDGKPSAAESITKNEIAACIELLERTPTHDPEKGIYLIGESYGSWVALVAAHYFPEKIKGVIYVSPSILLSYWKNENPQHKLEAESSTYLDLLIKSYGNRPALFIGSQKDKVSDNTSTIENVRFLNEKMGSNKQIIDADSSFHSFKLLTNKKDIRKMIIQWLLEQAK